MQNSKLFISIGNDNERDIVKSVYRHCGEALDRTSRFKYFTLHGKAHIDNIFSLIDILIGGGIEIGGHESYLLALSICMHDIGMVVPLSDKHIKEIFGGASQSYDPAVAEIYIRQNHHELASNYIENKFDFLISLGVAPDDMYFVKEISKIHRVHKLERAKGKVKYLGALLRIADELDIMSNRAPLSVLMNQYREMDPTSCWHWAKHNIVSDWSASENFNVSTTNGEKRSNFDSASDHQARKALIIG